LHFSYILQTKETGSFETFAATRIPNYTLFLTATQYFEIFVSSTIPIRQLNSNFTWYMDIK